MSAADYPRVDVKTAAEWRRWLRDHHAKERGAWLVSYRRVTGKPTIEYDDAVREALCYGWIDSVVKPLDEQRTISLYTPRKAGSGWSRSNKDRVKALVAEGRMRAAVGTSSNLIVTTSGTALTSSAMNCGDMLTPLTGGKSCITIGRPPSAPIRR